MESNIVKNLQMRVLGLQQSGLQHILLSKVQKLYSISPRSRDSENPSYACKVCNWNDINVFALAYEDGSIHFKFINDSNGPVVTSTIRIHNNAIYDVCWVPGEPKLLTASGDETTMMLNISGAAPKIEYSFQGHSASVRRVTVSPTSGYVFATGGRDGSIIIWDVRAPPYPQDTIRGAHRATVRNFRTHSVLDLKFFDGNHLISCGNADNCIKMWDLRRTHTINKKKAVHNYTLKNPTANKVFLDISIDPNGRQYYASSSCNKIYQYQYYSSVPDGWFEGADINSDFVRSCVSPEGDYLASGSLDNKGYIWSTRHNKRTPVLPLARLQGHSDPVTTMAWGSSKQGPLIVTCSDDNREFLWGVPHDGKNWESADLIEHIEIMNISKKATKSTQHLVLREPSVPQAQQSTPIKLTPAEERPSPLCTLTPELCTPSGSRRLAPEDCNGNRSEPNTPVFLQNLPNFVVDGTSPHNVITQVSINQKENIDWLTQHRKSAASEEKSRSQSSGKKRTGASSSGKKRRGWHSE